MDSLQKTRPELLKTAKVIKKKKKKKKESLRHCHNQEKQEDMTTKSNVVS